MPVVALEESRVAAQSERTWIDRLTPAGAFVLALALHLVALFVTGPWLSTDTADPVIFLVPGIAVGLALSANRLRTAQAVLGAGITSLIVFFATNSLDLTHAIAGMASYSIEVAVAIAGIFAMFSYRQLAKSPGPVRSLLALLICLVAASLGAIPKLLFTEFVSDVAQWIVAHAIGTIAVACAILVGRAGWLSTAHPRTQRVELSLLLGTMAALIAATIYLDSVFILVGLGALLLITARFGTRVGQPLALVFVLAVSSAAAHGQMLSDTPDRMNLNAFNGAAVVLTSIVGRMAYHGDLRIKEKQELAGRWKKLASTGFDGFVEIDANSAVIDASDSVARVVDLSIDEMRGQPIRSLFTDEGWQKIDHFVDLVMGGQTVRFDRSFQMASGDTLWALTVAEPRLDAKGDFDGCMIFLLDTTAVHRVNAERFESRAALAEAQEVERQRLAQLVHDGALQDLAAANLLIGAVRMNVAEELAAPASRSTHKTAEHLQRIESLLVSGMQKLRADAIGSDVIDLRDLSITSALEQTVAKFAAASTSSVSIDVSLTEEAPRERSHLIVQIAREALVNAIVHSDAKNIDVNIRRTRDGYSIAVIDDGVGFDTSRLQEVGHLGLSSMTALAFQAGGWCSLSTLPGRGTSLEAWIPDHFSQEEAVAVRGKPEAPSSR